MAKRERIVVKDEPKPKGKAKNNYFTSEKQNITFIHSGCTLLDCALGGGYAMGRVINLVGDKSTAKTGLATEALINFLRKYPGGVAAYRETEAAYDVAYAEAMGLPIDDVDFGGDAPLETVEDLYRDLDEFLEARLEDKRPGMYVLDSLDSLSDEAEMERDISKGSFGGAKPKKMSELFRKLTKKILRANVLLIIVSQVRDNIGVMMGDKQKRSGGKALDFYASQVMWMAHIKILKRTIKHVERPYGIALRAKIKKNKVGLPLRDVDFDFIFGFGVEDLSASVIWLKTVKRLGVLGLKEAEVKTYLTEVEGYEDKEYRKEKEEVAGHVRKVWAEIETSFLPVRGKYR